MPKQFKGQSVPAHQSRVRWCSPKPAKKHVIFLGAGASKSSGYPLADKLTLLMCDRRTFTEALRDVLLDERSDLEFTENSVIIKYQQLSEAAAVLRSGDFATMDELSKLIVGGSHAHNTSDLKKLMRLVLCLNDADAYHYSSSDYRPLIQRLFREGELREDISIVSFNYDPYLEFRLFRAFNARQRVRPFRGTDRVALSNAINSGFLDASDLTWTTRTGFCHLKLHGACVLPSSGAGGTLRLPPNDSDTLTADHVFRFGAVPRLASLCQPPFSKQDPPALLPWEVIHDDGRLLVQDEFKEAVGKEWQHTALFELFKAIWTRAREEVQQADKISFVGLSLNAFMEPEMKFLFEGKRGDLQFVIANPENERFKEYENQMHPASPSGRAFDLLAKRIKTDLKFYGSFSEYDTGFDESIYDAEYQPTITCHSTFREFIQAEV